MEKYTLYIYNRKTGKVIECVESCSQGMLKLYLMQKLTKTRDAIIVDDNNKPVARYIGQADGRCPVKASVDVSVQMF